MSRPRFLADNDLNDAIVQGVLRREPGIEFARLRELGMDRRPDGEVLEYAANFSIVTVEQAVAAVGGLRESFDPAGKG